MPRLLTKYLGWIEYDEAGVVDFPAGVPGFEHERRFLFIRNEAHAPVVFLQSVQSPGLCFLALPAREVETGYRLDMAEEDAAVLGLEGGAGGEDLEVLALISHRAGEAATANLVAPVVVHGPGRRAVQAVRRDRRYGARHVLAGCVERHGVC